jgi:acetyl esterase/lipase
MKIEVNKMSANENSFLTSYLLDSPATMPNTELRPGILIFPGGGYWRISEREAEPIAMAFLAEGYHAFVLHYSINENADFPKPLRDAEEAMELIHNKATDWGVNKYKIAVCGFSAGGHLAAALGTMGQIRPRGLILGYPCILETISEILPTPIPSLEQLVDNHTPPSFIFSTANDALVPVENSLQFAVALNQANIPFEIHVFQDGTHGLSLAKPHTSGGFYQWVNANVAQWFDLCLSWLEKLFGEFKADSVLSASFAGTNSPQFSIDKPLEICWKNPDAREIILTYIPGFDELPAFRNFLSTPLRIINQYDKLVDQSTLSEIDQKLRELLLTTPKLKNRD